MTEPESPKLPAFLERIVVPAISGAILAAIVACWRWLRGTTFPETTNIFLDMTVAGVVFVVGTNFRIWVRDRNRPAQP